MMVNKEISEVQTPSDYAVSIIRHKQVCKRLQISSAKLFDMVAKGLFPKPFVIVPNGRATGWLESDVEKWILNRLKGGV
jgi:prophage regulatory protein